MSEEISNITQAVQRLQTTANDEVMTLLQDDLQTVLRYLHSLEVLALPISDTPRQVYDTGFIDGLEAYAHWHDGVLKVGTTGKTLAEAVATRAETWNYQGEKYK